MENLNSENSSIFNQELHINSVDQGVRFANWIIDRLVTFGLTYLMGMLIGFVIIITGGDLDFLDNNFAIRLFDFAVGVFVYLFYYTIMEGATKGKTVGKFITKTTGVDTINFKPITWSMAFKRSLCRIIPFEVFSGFSYAPWHDTMTNTTVVKIASSQQSEFYTSNDNNYNYQD